MKLQIETLEQFTDCMKPTAGRQFSYEGITSLWVYLRDREQATGREMVCDPVAFCCEYDEQPYSDIASDYGINLGSDIGPLDWYDQLCVVHEWLTDRGLFVGYGDDHHIVYSKNVGAQNEI